MKRHRMRGFTLIEIMIVVAIVGILAAIAYPSYRDAILKGRRAAGRAALAELLQQQERYMTQNNAYLQFTNSGGTTTPSSAASTFKVYSGDNASSPQYWLSADTSCSSSSTVKDCVTLTATPTQLDPKVGNISITSTGIKSCSATNDPKLCWP